MFRNRCPHSDVRPIHGDEINHVGGYRLQCNDCRRYLDGHVVIAQLRADERAKVDEWLADRP